MNLFLPNTYKPYISKYRKSEKQKGVDKNIANALAWYIYSCYLGKVFLAEQKKNASRDKIKSFDLEDFTLAVSTSTFSWN